MINVAKLVLNMAQKLILFYCVVKTINLSMLFGCYTIFSVCGRIKNQIRHTVFIICFQRFNVSRLIKLGWVRQGEVKAWNRDEKFQYWFWIQLKILWFFCLFQTSIIISLNSKFRFIYWFLMFLISLAV